MTSPRTTKVTTNILANPAPTPITMWANSRDRMLFTFMKGADTPLDLTGFTLGCYLMTGSARTSIVCIRPATATGLPSTTGVTVIDAARGEVELIPQPSDFTNAHTTPVWLEIWQTVYPTSPSTTPATSGGSLADATFYYQVVAIVDGVETLAASEVTGTVSGGSGSGKVTVDWTVVAGATGYRVYVKQAVGGTYGYFTIGSGSTDTYEHTTMAGYTAADPPTVDVFRTMLGQYRVTVMPN